MSIQAEIERLFEQINEELKGLAPYLPKISFKAKIREVKEFRAAYDTADKAGTLSPRVRELVVKMGLMSGKSLFTRPAGQSPHIELSTQKEAIDWIDANKDTFVQSAKKHTEHIQNFPLNDKNIHQDARLVAANTFAIHHQEPGSNFLKIFVREWNKHVFFNYIKVYDSDPKVPSDFISTLPRPDSPAAIEQIKKAVKGFRAAWQPSADKKPSLAQTYQLVAKGLGFKTWEAVVARVCNPRKT